MAAAAALFRRASSHLARLPRPLFPSDSLESPFAHGSSAGSPSLPGFSFDASMELMAVPKKNVSRHKKGLRNGPKALKPVPVIVRCKSCGRVKLPHFYCCSGDTGNSGLSSS
ncbi:uncharacterized protein LOC103974252 [Musa acuminata AAA Group]|uniref:Large ribosomal subunit protein bL32m n=1 Tax=Musa acuminata subsp. malaccensis TaxID=214687 RepID=A0A804J522_MUSAM|nr:PREDICTED: uncharacterized protein LOC103974252 [Musa acuminata subsp. malaccensis]CAG1838804.1 unnamed protein product [Musa acuminata subsp. malaccensis]